MILWPLGTVDIWETEKKKKKVKGKEKKKVKLMSFVMFLHKSRWEIGIRWNIQVALFYFFYFFSHSSKAVWVKFHHARESENPVDLTMMWRKSLWLWSKRWNWIFTKIALSTLFVLRFFFSFFWFSYQEKFGQMYSLSLNIYEEWKSTS